ncbi:Zinc finger PHD-type domain-containing protein [Caenorhabditis elegans]|uniref:Zinc finger PHD-type domain-containing protein n=2 Tax=Caenorhabditis elegans TaxID=6239 RepID=A0A131MDG3_CAEEL|nr:Zinc finger PHD-type domain-containing protein [Caenorhabditis elegans]CZR14613.1 Zinc finger PHD-type domain-containing protein [Caenorhabditis elegans]|eukprot:NP_509788.2 PHd Finger family [Caenorhabditis elegans]
MCDHPRIFQMHLIERASKVYKWTETADSIIVDDQFGTYISERISSWRKILAESREVVLSYPEDSDSDSPGPSSVDARKVPKSEAKKRGRENKKLVHNDSSENKEPSESPTADPTMKKPLWPCAVCNASAKFGSCKCKGCDQWSHLTCVGIKMKDFTEGWKCGACCAQE